MSGVIVIIYGICISYVCVYITAVTYHSIAS